VVFLLLIEERMPTAAKITKNAKKLETMMAIPIFIKNFFEY